MRDTETELIAALESGQIDYLAIYRSDALQHRFRYLQLPSQIDLSNAKYASLYAQASVQTVNGTVTGKPIVYAVTIPNNAAHFDWALTYMRFLLGKPGQDILAQNGFGSLTPAYASDMSKVPVDLRKAVTSWPKQ